MTETDEFPLTPPQQRLWFIHRLNPQSTAYNAPVVRTLRGRVDPARLEHALLQLVQRHEQLRAAFAMRSTEPVQMIREVPSVELVFVENMVPKDVSTKITEFIQPFALEHAPLLRAALFHVLDELESSYVLVLDIHHIICDFSSEEILARDLFRLYHDLPLPELDCSYLAHAQKQTESASAAVQRATDEEFWLSKLSGELPILQLPVDHRRPAVFDFYGTIRHFSMGRDRTKALRAYSALHGVPLQDIALTAVFVLLAKYSLQEDLIVGTPHEVRSCDDVGDVVGMFMNTLSIRANVHPDNTSRTLLAEISDDVREARQHASYDVRYLVEKLKPQRDPSRNALYDVLFFHQLQESQIYDGLQVTPRQFIHEKAEVDLTFGLVEIDDRLSFSIEFATSLFRPSSIERMAKHYGAVLDALVGSPDDQVVDIDILSDDEHARVASFSGRASPYPWKTIHGLFEEQVDRSPDHPALRYRSETLSYAELDARANRVANMLRARGAKAGDVIALFAHPSPDMVAGSLGILKAGCAYLPITPNLPTTRTAYMLDSSKARFLLVQQPSTGFADIEIIELGLADLFPADRPHCECVPSALACVLFTSGSTGKPKGTLARHFNVVRTVINTNYLAIQASDHVLQMSSPTFDVSMLEIFGAVLNGATSVVVDSGSRGDLSRIATLLDTEHISVAFMTPALFNAIVDERLSALKGLRKILIGGDRASADHMRKALAQLGPGKLMNVYGPTEATIFTTYYPVDDVPEDATNIPIGYPLSNTKILILNGRSPVPVNVAGELCIAGDGVVAGYLDKDLTSQRFVNIGGDRFYRTGDIAKWREDGAIEYVGRLDRQVKIRGQRIEPEEIEAVLQAHPGVKEAAVIVRANERGDKSLQAFCTCAADNSTTPDELTAHIGRHLPRYMIPASLATIEAMPLDANGKIDRHRLQSTVLPATEDDAEHPPVTAVEKIIAATLRELLGVSVVNVYRSIFDYEAHSLTAAILSSRLEDALNVPFPLRDIFEHPTIASLAAHLSGVSGSTSDRYRHRSPILRNPRRAHYPLSFSERMVYAHQHATAGNHCYHNIFPMLIEGPLEIEKLEQAFRTVVRRHEAFRSKFVVRDGIPVKSVVDRVDFHLQLMQGTESDVPAVVSRLRQPYDLTKPPLVRACLLTVGEERHVLIVANHHIVSDGVTESMFMREIGLCYRGESLEPCSLQYSDYTLWQQRELEVGHYREEEQHWLAQLRGPLPVLELPLDHPRPSETDFNGRTLTIGLDTQQTSGLRRLAAAHHTTLFTLLFAAYAVLLHKYSGQDDLIVGIPVANRTHADLASVAGMFVNMVPLRTQPVPGQSFSEYIEAVKEVAVSAFEHQSYPFERMVQAVKGERDPSRNPLFDTIFAFQSTGPVVLDIEGLHSELYPLPDAAAKVDLTLEAFQFSNQIQLSFTYATALFRESTIARMAESFTRLISDMVRDPRKRLRELRWLSADSVDPGIAVVQSYPRDKSLYGLFEECVRRFPQRVAVRFRGESLTYAQLHARAESMAVRLRELGVRPGEPVALMTARSVEMVVGILAILRAGATYVPIDPEYPPERVQSILQNSGSSICLTVDMIRARQGAVVDTSVLSPVGVPVGPAYIMYTSGSTGVPKGIAVAHHSVTRTVMNTNYVTVEPEDNVLQLVNYAFDGSVFDIFGALLNGATLVVPEQDDITDPDRLAAIINNAGASIVLMTTALFNAYIDHDPMIFAPLRKVLFGGERASVWHVKKALTHLGPGKLVHAYGPTEATSITSAHGVNVVVDDVVPIGKPLSNTRLYVLDGDRQPVAVGVVGELYIGGDGVGMGYWGDARLTCQRFVPDPWVAGAVMYRSGDMVKWLDTGDLVYVGRVDEQIKLRGFRIEPGEIEARLLEHPAVGQCAVIVKGDRLVAFYTSDEPVDDTLLKTHLRTTLPYYMVPDRFEHTDRLPLTNNGKIDRQTLATYSARSTTRQPHTPPETSMEQLLVTLWCKVFERDVVGIDDNFYALGGHSMKALEIISLLQASGHTLSASDLFRHPTIREVAHAVRPLSPRADTSIQSSPDEGFALSAVQHRFFQRDLVDRGIFNSPFLIMLNEYVDPAIVEDAVLRTVQSHRILTARFEEFSGGWRQYYQSPVARRCFTRVDLAGVTPVDHVAAISARCAALQHDFDLSEGHLYRVLLFENYQHRNRQVLFFLFHHLVFDRTSWEVFLEEFRRHCVNEPIPPNRSISYSEWCLRLQRYADEGSFTDAARFWQTMVRRGEPFLPDTLQSPFALQSEMLHYTTRPLHGPEFISGLDGAMETYQANAFHLVLAAFGEACRDLQPRTSLPLYVMSAQRESFLADADITRSVGFFAGAYPLRIDLSADGIIRETVENVKHALFASPREGLDYFMVRYMPSLRERYDGLDHPYPLLFHFINDRDRTGNGFSTPLEVPVGLTHSPHNPSAYLLNVTAVLDSAGLKLTFYYSRAHFHADTIERLSRSFEQHLQDIVLTDDHSRVRQ
ncbi:amino acid adenylation enzyme/thioester reductase family protein [Mycolicibacterium rhodesiae NBB3]|uniref:Amino acid adenylation enzyme/thioester reductase family protein n=1 Tax=Mycolicibacterium rhodesiae (strain NBB3) TaxID=710685 RepID=G8RVQ3_MYCRN|nr:non-ribosomal peptide synthetase [Mycolicibacterium rhodesiae]AEV75486.1 amino acid adenylation enzyme/thioester reductase family protein [Mycolicibacterium rhodesiae NBB3]